MMEYLMSSGLAVYIPIVVIVGLFIFAMSNADTAIEEQLNKKPRWRHLKK